jgi:hypothetical protein
MYYLIDAFNQNIMKVKTNEEASHQLQVGNWAFAIDDIAEVCIRYSTKKDLFEVAKINYKL